MGPLVIEDRTSTLVGGGEGGKASCSDIDMVGSTDMDVDLVDILDGRGPRCCELLAIGLVG